MDRKSHGCRGTNPADFLERQCAEQWETIDSLEREQRRSLEDTWHEWQDDACECIDWDLVREDDDE